MLELAETHRKAKASATPTEDLLQTIEALRVSHNSACSLVARMHKAAVGRVCGPIRGVVEDVADLRDAFESQSDLLEQERMMHAACLSIAEGQPGWKNDSPYGYKDSEATAAVRRLRAQFEALRAECQELKKRL